MKILFLLLYFLILNLNSSAQYVWMNTYSFDLDNYVNSADTSSDQGYFITGGETDQGFGGNYFAAKLDSNGNEIWQIIGNRYIGIVGNNSGRCIVNTGDGGCLVGGILENDFDIDLYFIRLDSSGHVIWEKNYGGMNDQHLGSIIKVGNNYLCSVVSVTPQPQSYL